MQPLWQERNERIWGSHLQAARSNSSIVGDVEKSYDVSGLYLSENELEFALAQVSLCMKIGYRNFEANPVTEWTAPLS